MKIEIYQPLSFCEIGKRENQEDAIRPCVGDVNENCKLYVLCDGMGGSDDGEIASNTVANSFVEYFEKNVIPDALFTPIVFHKALSYAYDELDKKDNGKIINKMGTTLCLLYIHSGGVFVAHIGDSRIYQIRPSKKRIIYKSHDHSNSRRGRATKASGIIYKSHDHSKVMDMIALGEITPEQAKSVSYRNVVTRIMQPTNSRDKAEECQLTDIEPEDYFFICSDGVLENVEDEELIALISDDRLNDQQKMEKIIHITSNNKDNHSAHCIHIKNVRNAQMNDKNGNNLIGDKKNIFYKFANCKKQSVRRKRDFPRMIILILLLTTIFMVMTAFFYL